MTQWIREWSIAGYRREYRKTWDRDWPFEDDYLRELEREAMGKRVDTLELMRETHEFEEENQHPPQT